MAKESEPLTDEQYEERFPSIRLAPELLRSDNEMAITREAPYFMRGRDPETATLAMKIMRMPKPVRLITGPPGSGKSSLLTHMRAFAELHGFETCVIEAADWVSDEALAKLIYPASATVREVSTDAEGEINFGAAKIGGGKEWSESELPILSPIDAINQRAAESDKGLLVLIDEFQNLVKEADDVQARVRRVLDYFHSSVPQGRTRDKDGRRIRTMCLAAGLLDSLTAAEELGLTRITDSDCVRLANISLAASAQVIRDHLNVRSNGKGGLATATDEQVDRIAISTEGYTHHLSIAAQLTQAAAQSAKHEGLSALSDEMVDRIVRNSNDEKETLYQRRVGALGRGRGFIAVLVAELADAWSTGIPPKVLTKAMNRVRNALHRSGEAVTFDELTERLQRSGVLEKRASTHRFPAAIKPTEGKLDAHWTIPIPSLKSYIQENRDDHEPPPDLEVDLCDLVGEAAKREYPAPTPWKWRERATAESARKVPPVEKSKILAWMKKRATELIDWHS